MGVVPGDWVIHMGIEGFWEDTQHVSEGRSRLIGTGLRRGDPGAEPMYNKYKI